MGPKIIDRSEAAGVNRWDYPSVDDSAAHELKGVQGRDAHLLTARQVDELQSQAHQEAYERGHREGLEAGRAEAAARVARLDAVGAALARPLQDMDHALERDLLALATVLATQILHRELAWDPAGIVGSLRDCLDLLPTSAREITIHVAPADAAVIREHLTEEPARPWRLAEDAELEPGDLRISSETSQIDGTLEARLAEMIASAIAGLDTAETSRDDTG